MMSIDKARNGGIDALRAVMTALVVFHHAAITYGADGGWYYRERLPSDDPQSIALTFFCTINQAYFMGLFFLIAGCFTPGAIGSRGGAWPFLRARLIRLGLPLVVYGFLIGPATIALARTARGDDFLTVFLGLLSRGRYESGPLWFAEALLLFALGFLVWYFINPAGPRAVRPLPGDRALVVAAAVTGLAAFLIRLDWPVGRDLLGLQFGYFPSYIVLFAAGCLGAAGRWLERVPPDMARRWRRVAWIALPILPIAALLGPKIGLGGSPRGGFNVPAMVYAWWEPCIAWGVIMSLLIWFQRRFADVTPFWRAMSARAFAVYIIHPPILVGVALAWSGIAAPALVKFLITGTIAWILCFAVAGLLLRIPLLRRVL